MVEKNLVPSVDLIRSPPLYRVLSFVLYLPVYLPVRFEVETVRPTSGNPPFVLSMCVFITAVPITKLFAWGGWNREEPVTLTQGAPVSPGSSRLGNEPET